MLFLLSPSKSQDFTQDIPKNITKFVSNTEFMNKSSEIISVYKQFSTKYLMKIFSVSENIASLNVERFALWKKNPEITNVKPAIQAFTGTVYNSFEYEKYSQEQCEYADKNLKIISGLYGIISPFSQIQPYRLEMGIRQSFTINNIEYKNLYDFWKPTLTQKIITDCKANNTNIIINLASVEYSKILDKKKLIQENISIIDIDFKILKTDISGKEILKTVAIYAKKQRGKIMNWAIKNLIETVEDVTKYPDENFIFSQKNSTNKKLCFIWKQS